MSKRIMFVEQPVLLQVEQMKGMHVIILQIYRSLLMVFQVHFVSQVCGTIAA